MKKFQTFTLSKQRESVLGDPEDCASYAHDDAKLAGWHLDLMINKCKAPPVSPFHRYKSDSFSREISGWTQHLSRFTYWQIETLWVTVSPANLGLVFHQCSSVSSLFSDHPLSSFIRPLNGPLVTCLETAVTLAVKGGPDWAGKCWVALINLEINLYCITLQFPVEERHLDRWQLDLSLFSH